MAKRAGRGRERGQIRQRGGSYQVLMYGGIDPLTGKEIRVAESTADPREADRICSRAWVIGWFIQVSPVPRGEGAEEALESNGER
jgi:hypothetical protein